MSYRFQISTDSTFGSLFVDRNELVDSTQVVSGFSSDSTYYWRVNAANEVGTGPWSEVRNFVTEAVLVKYFALAFYDYSYVRLFKSTNLKSWTPVLFGEGYNEYSVNKAYYVSGKLIASIQNAGSGGPDYKIAVSDDDGDSWIFYTHPFAWVLSSFFYSGSYFVVEGYDGEYFHYLKSTDGLVWSEISGITGDGISGFVYYNSTYFVFTTTEIYSSSNMIDWSKIKDSPNTSNEMYFTIYGGELYCSSNLLESESPQLIKTTDCITWSPVYIPTNPSGYSLHGIGAGATADATMVWIPFTAGEGGLVVFYSKSINGVDWTDPPVRPSLGDGAPGFLIVHDGTQFILAGTVYTDNQFFILTSPDGETWTPVEGIVTPEGTQAIDRLIVEE